MGDVVQVQEYVLGERRRIDLGWEGVVCGVCFLPVLCLLGVAAFVAGILSLGQAFEFAVSGDAMVTSSVGLYYVVRCGETVIDAWLTSTRHRQHGAQEDR